MQDEQKNEQQFEPLRFLTNASRFLRHTWWIVVLAAALAALVAGIYVRETYSPKYECHAVLSVQSSNSTVTDIINTSEKAEANITKQIIKTFPAIIESDAMKDRIQRITGQSKINGTITPTVIAESNLFTLTVTSSSPQDAYDILNAVLKSYPEMAFIFIGAAEIDLIEAPTLPTEPTEKMNIVKPAVWSGLILGLVALIILSLLGQLQATVNSSTDLQRYSNVPCIVHIPQTVLKRRSRRHNNQLSLLNSHLPASFEESIRVLRSRLLRKIKEQNLRTIIITSTIPGEGKSTVAANLALSFSHSNLRVVLVDADLRTQELHDFFNLEGETRGLTDLLQDRKLDPVECLTPVPDTNVRLLCGSTLDRPISLLRRGRLARILERLKEEADIVLIDTPPIGLLTDAASFAQHADGAIYVVRSGISSGNRIADGMQAIADCKTQLLGYVLNGVSARAGSHGYGYRYSYGYGYGSYGRNYAAGYSGSYRSSYRYGGYGYGYGYSHYGSGYGYGGYGGYGYGGYGYGGYGGYGGYSGYGGYGGYAAMASASEQQKSSEKSSRRKSKHSSSRSGSSSKRRSVHGKKSRTQSAAPKAKAAQTVPETLAPAVPALDARADMIDVPAEAVQPVVETPVEAVVEAPVEAVEQVVEAPVEETVVEAVEAPVEAAIEAVEAPVEAEVEAVEAPVEAAVEAVEAPVEAAEEIVEAVEAAAEEAVEAPVEEPPARKKGGKKSGGKKKGK